MKRIHVLYIVENNTVPKDRRVWRQAIAVKKRGFEVSVICPKEGQFKASRETIDGIDIYRHSLPPDLPTRLSFLVEYAWAILIQYLMAIRLYISKPFHIIHGANPPDNIFLIALFFKLFGVKYIYDVHDLSPELFSALFNRKDGFYHKALVISERLSCKVADAVITTNQSYQEILMERNDIKPDCIFIVRNDPSIEDCNFVERQDTGNGGKQKLILYLGTINQQDGVISLIRSLYHLVNVLNEKDFKCIIIGSGRSVPEVKTAIAESDLEQYVEMKGFIGDRNVLRHYLGMADVCVEPAPGFEINNISTFIKILEYMASGKPIVAFDLKESRYSAGESALFVRPGDIEGFSLAIHQLLHDKTQGLKMGNIGKERILTLLNWEKSIDNLKKAYDSLLPNSSIN